jgi:hypothetical protein
VPQGKGYTEPERKWKSYYVKRVYIMYNENFKIAFEKSMDERMILPFTNVPDYQFSKKFEKKMQSLFKHPHSYIIAKNKPIPLRKIIICAIISLSMLVLSFTTAAYWEEIKSFFMEIFSDHTRVIHDVEGEFPETIETIYMPQYIPDRFILEDSDAGILSTYFYYQSDTGYFSFEQYTKSVVIHINSEMSEVNTIQVNGYDGYYLKIDNEINLTWVTDEYAFIIMGNIDINEAVRIAESVTFTEPY